MEDGWYLVKDTGKPKQRPSIHWIENNRMQGGIKVDLQIRLGFTFEPVHVFSEKELDVLLEDRESSAYQQGRDSVMSEGEW